MSWEIGTLGNYSKVISGYAFKSDSFRTDNGIPIIKIKNIQREYVEIDGEYFVDTSYLSLDPKFHCIKDDILISLTGSHITLPNSVVGRVAKYHYEYTSLLNQRGGKIVVTNPDKLENNYLYYYLCQNEIRIKLAQFGRGGANQCNISPSNVESIPIILPPLETQKRIASILSTYDDLIENNLKRIKLLEETAQNIYKEWFVNFRFPNYEHTEFDAESGLPVGWEITELEHLVTLRQGFALNKKSGHHISNEVTEYPLLKISDLFNDTETLFVKDSIPKQFLVDEEEIIFSRTGQVGHAFMGRKGVIYNNCFRVIANKNINTYFLFSTMLFPSFVSYSKGLATGVAQPDLNHGAFKSIKITNPSIELQNEFSLIFKKNLQLKYCLKKQNQKLKEARDILLPRLINRTIEV